MLAYLDEKLMRINVLELKKILLILKSFVKTSHKHIKIMSDNTTAIQCITKMGTSYSMECHHQLLKIQEWTTIHKNHLLAAHIPRMLNGCPNQSFRIWNYLCFKPEIDLFATNINTQFGKYAVFRSDLEEMYIDAFSIDWSDLNFYAFSPVLVTAKVLSKVKQDSARVL